VNVTVAVVPLTSTFVIVGEPGLAPAVNVKSFDALVARE